MFGQDITSCSTCALGRVCTPGTCPWRWTPVTAGSAIAYQDASQTIAFVRSGLVLESQADRRGDDRYCHIRGGGTLLGWNRLVDRTIDVVCVALTAVELCVLPSLTVRAWIRENSRSAVALLELAIDEIHQQTRAHIALRGSADARLARFLLERRRSGAEHDDLPIDQRLLARLLGVRPETLSRTLRRFRNAGLVQADGLRTSANVLELERVAGD